MPIYKYRHNETGEIKEFSASIKDKDNIVGWTRIASFPDEIRTSSNAATFVDGRASYDPKYKLALDLADLECEHDNAKTQDERDEIKAEIKRKKEDNI